tara:strand:- start:320 stop:946 length:627 start_codon:yes stop_codon:yes gene_type:complete
MNKFYRLLFFILILITGCKTINDDEKKITQSINSLNMNIYSSEGHKLVSIKSPYSNYDKDKNIFNLRETTIKLFKNNKSEYKISSDNSIISNNNKLIELNGNVIVETLIKKQDILYSNSFTWNIKNSEFLLVGNVKYKNESLSLSSNKAILNKSNNIIEFFSPVQYKFIDNNNEKRYEVNAQNAYYNIDTRSVIFRSNEERVRSKIYF